MSEILGQYEKELPIEESPNSDFYIRGLNSLEESVRIPFTQVGSPPYCVVDFVCFVGTTQHTIPFQVLERTPVRFEDRVHTNRAIFSYEWHITDEQTDFTVTPYAKSPTHQFNQAGIFSISLVVKDAEGNILGNITKVNHITVAAQPITLYQVLFTVVDDDSSEPISGAPVMFNNQTTNTDLNGQALFENITSGSFLGCSVILSGYLSHSSIVHVTSNMEVEIRMVEQAGPPIPINYDPIYIGYLVEETQGTVLSTEIVQGETYSTQQKALNTAINSPQFPVQVNAQWKSLFSTLNPFVLYTLFLALPGDLNDDEDLTYYQNMDAPIIQGLLSTQCTVEDMILDIEDSGSGSGVPTDYRVYKFEAFGPVNYRLSLTSF